MMAVIKSKRKPAKKSSKINKNPIQEDIINKDLLKKPKEKINKAIKNVNKHKKKIIITAVFGGIILVFILLLLGIELSFTLNNELEINLEPLDISIDTIKNVNNDIEFKLRNDNFFFCRSSCIYEFRDISGNATIDSGTMLLKSDEEQSRTYSISTDKNGEGQKIYLFEIECNNIRSALCRTSEDARLKSSIVTLNYLLSDDEKQIKNNLSSALPLYLNKLRSADSQITSVSGWAQNLSEHLAIDGKVPEELSSVFKKIKEQEKNIASEIKKAQDYKKLWSDEEYTALFEQFIPSIPDIKEINESLKNTISMHNRIEGSLSFLSAIKLSEIAEFYSKTGHDNLSLKAIVLNRKVLELIQKANSYDFSYADLMNDAEKLSEETALFEKQYIIEREIMLFKLRADTYRAKILLGDEAEFDMPSCKTIQQLNSRISLYNSMVIISNDSDINSIIPKYRENLTIAIDNEIILISNNTIPGGIIKKREPINISLISNFNSSIDYRQYINIDEIDATLCKNSSAVRLKKTPLILPRAEVEFKKTQSTLETEISSNNAECCFKGLCTDCCIECTEESLYPVLFIHGHAVNEKNSPELSLSSFAKIQHKLLEDGFINAGQINLDTNLNNISSGEWGRMPHPLAVRASYYYISFYDLGAYSVTTKKTDSIENYAIRLKEIIDIVREKTGRDKVNIVAHSMGGLAAREYIVLFGEDNVGKLILIGTPNHGVSGKVKSFCGIIGNDKECEDLAQNSIFLKRLNSPQNTPDKVEVHTIAAVGCNDMQFDGIVMLESVQLDFAQNHVIEGKCSDIFKTDLHSNILDPERYPETYELLLDILKE